MKLRNSSLNWRLRSTSPYLFVRLDKPLSSCGCENQRTGAEIDVRILIAKSRSRLFQILSCYGRNSVCIVGVKSVRLGILIYSCCTSRTSTTVRLALPVYEIRPLSHSWALLSSLTYILPSPPLFPLGPPLPHPPAALSTPQTANDKPYEPHTSHVQTSTPAYVLAQL